MSDSFTERNTKLKVEIAAVILLTVGRAVANDIGVMIWLGSIPTRPFGYFHFTECLRSLYLSGLVLFIVFLTQECWIEIGLSTPHWGKDFVIGLATIFVTALLWIVLFVLFKMFGSHYLDQTPAPFRGPSTKVEYAWIFVSALMVGFAEELLLRGYLISRLLRLFDPWKSILLSSLVFAAWHISKGTFGVAHTFIWGLVYGFTFTQTRRLWPVVIGHSMSNMIADFVSTI